MALYTDREDIDMKFIYAVYDEIHGLRRYFSNEIAARECVEHISVIEYGLRSDAEIFTSRWGNEFVWWSIYQVYDTLEEAKI